MTVFSPVFFVVVVLLETIFVTFSFSSLFFPCPSKLVVCKNDQHYVKLPIIHKVASIPYCLISNRIPYAEITIISVNITMRSKLFS